MINRLISCCTAFVCCLSVSFSQYRQQGSPLVPNDYSGPASQGKAVAISSDGNTAILGGYTDNALAGAAWVYTRTGTVWSQQGPKLVGSNASSNARQGVSVGISADGNTAIVGGYVDNGGVGAAWIFTRSGNVWSQQGTKLIGAGYSGAPLQGISVAISGDGNTAIFGGQLDNSNIGAAWIFVRNGSTWSQQGTKLVGTGAVGGALQGSAVSLSWDGNTAAVGGIYDNSQVGAVWIFTRSDTTWSQQGPKLVGSGFVGGSVQGASVSLSSDGNTLAEGGHYDNGNQGAFWVFIRSAGVWSQQGGKLFGAEVGGIPYNGRRLRISADGNTIVEGGLYDNNNFGGVWVFTKTAGVWSQSGPKINAPGLGSNPEGGDVVISDDGRTILAGSEGYAGGVGAGIVFVVDTSRVAAYWSMNESSGSMVFDSSGWGNHGTAYGTTIIPGVSGNARRFDGAGDYIYVPNPINHSLDFDSSESFTISAWFRSATNKYPEILRKGLAGPPGYDLRLANGHLLAEIGNRWNGIPPDTVLQIYSDNLVNDGNWHFATLVRDRELRKIFLYVDNLPASHPVDDNFPYPLRNNAPLEIGRWGVTPGVEDFDGDIDEVTISKGLGHPPAAFQPRIAVSPSSLNFDPTMVGEHSSAQLWVSNTGIRETLNVAGIVSTNPAVTPDMSGFSVLPGASQALQLLYAPTGVHADTGSVIITSNDPEKPEVSIPLSGSGYVPTLEPMITKIMDIEHDQGRQVRVIWAKSVNDDAIAAPAAAEYGVWRRVDDVPPSLSQLKTAERKIFELGGKKHVIVNGQLWDFIISIPAVHFTQYSYVAPTLLDATEGNIPWFVFEVSVHLSDGSFYFSAPDSGYSIDNLSPNAPAQMSIYPQSNTLVVGWAKADEPDLSHYNVYRSTAASTSPAAMAWVGTSQTNNYVDRLVNPSLVYYYRVRSVDAAGNLSGFSSEVGSPLSGVDPQKELPASFSLSQNYPNPFNPSTTIQYSVAKATHVKLALYNVLGQEVKVLVDEVQNPGYKVVRLNGEGLASGVYMYRIVAGTFIESKRMLFIK